MTESFAGIDRTVSVELDSLVGVHTVDARAEIDGHGRTLYLRIDGLIYAFSEDPDDGYRSLLREVSRWDHGDVSRFDVKFAEFAPVVCNFVMRTNDYRVLYAVDERTGLVILEVGTENFDDYYPIFVARWVPDEFEAAWLKP